MTTILVTFCIALSLSNIESGSRRARMSRKEFLQFLSIYQGSLSELDTYVEVSHRLGFSMKTKFRNWMKMPEVDRLLYGLMKSVWKQDSNGARQQVVK